MASAGKNPLVRPRRRDLRDALRPRPLVRLPVFGDFARISSGTRAPGAADRVRHVAVRHRRKAFPVRAGRDGRHFRRVHPAAAGGTRRDPAQNILEQGHDRHFHRRGRDDRLHGLRRHGRAGDVRPAAGSGQYFARGSVFVSAGDGAFRRAVPWIAGDRTQTAAPGKFPQPGSVLRRDQRGTRLSLDPHRHGPCHQPLLRPGVPPAESADRRTARRGTAQRARRTCQSPCTGDDPRRPDRRLPRGTP